MKKEYNFSKGKRGAVISSAGKTRITIYLDNDVLEEFRNRADNEGTGYQTMINHVLRSFLHKKLPDQAALRRVVREELTKIFGKEKKLTKEFENKAEKQRHLLTKIKAVTEEKKQLEKIAYQLHGQLGMGNSEPILLQIIENDKRMSEEDRELSELYDQFEKVL